MSLHTLSVGKRLGLIAGAGIVTCTFLGVFAIMQLREVQATGEFMAADVVPSINFINEINDDANNLREYELNYVLAKTAEQLSTEESAAKELKATINAGMEKYAGLIDNNDERKAFENLKQQLAMYMAENEKTLAGAKQIINGNQVDMTEQVRDVSGKAFDTLGSRIDELIVFNLKSAQESHVHAKSVYETALNTIIFLIIASLVIASGLAMWISRGLLKQLGGEPVYGAEIAGKIAQGDLAVVIHTGENDTSSLLYALKAMRDNLVKIVTEVRTGTETMATAANQIASGNLDLSSRTEEQASSLEETASSMEELTSTVKQNSENARQANQLAASASEVAEKGGIVMTQVVDTMSSINDSSKRIADIINVIDGIAFQTNILALNAAVEAARAGEQGRGFAVVASEVRNLAQRSAGAAREIRDLINDSVEKVGAGSKLVGEAGTTMDEIVNGVKRVTDIMSEITAASQEQTAGIEQINQAIAQMDEVTQQNASLVEEAAAASAAMQEQAAQLSKVVSVFKLEQMQAAPGASVRSMEGKTASARSQAVRKAVPALKSGKAVRVKPASPAPVTSGGDWEEF